MYVLVRAVEGLSQVVAQPLVHVMGLCGLGIEAEDELCIRSWQG